MGKNTSIPNSKNASARVNGAARHAGNGRRWHATEEFFVRLAAEADAAHKAGRELPREALADVMATAQRHGKLEPVEPKPPPTAV